MNELRKLVEAKLVLSYTDRKKEVFLATSTVIRPRRRPKNDGGRHRVYTTRERLFRGRVFFWIWRSYSQFLGEDEEEGEQGERSAI